jgi:hypothetical protein
MDAEPRIRGADKVSAVQIRVLAEALIEAAKSLYQSVEQVCWSSDVSVDRKLGRSGERKERPKGLSS